MVAELIVIQDVAAPPNNTAGELWPRLTLRLTEKGVLPTGTEPDADGVCSGIRTWLADHPRSRLMVMLDECDFFLRADADSNFANVVRLRDTMADGDHRFKVVFSGLQHVARYRRLPNQPLSHFAEPLVIGPLDAPSACELVRRPLHAVGWSITDSQVDRIVTFCACNPSVIQLTCAALLNRLHELSADHLAPWEVPDEVVDELLRSTEISRGVRDRLFLTLDLDHRYKMLAFLLAWRAAEDGLAAAVPPAALRRMANDYWPEGFASQRTDDVRALCDELVGLGVFAGDAESGYRMLSPGTARVFGDTEDIFDELVHAPETYETDRALGAAGNRMPLPKLGARRYSPLTAAQLADVVGAGATQTRIVVGSRATRVDTVIPALAEAVSSKFANTRTAEATSLKSWRDLMRAPASGHVVAVSDMTVRSSHHSWDESLEAARRRGQSRGRSSSRSAVLVAGPEPRWLLSRLVTTADGRAGDLADITVALTRVDLASLKAWDRIEELDLASLTRQARLLEVTGGWPMLVERVLTATADAGFDGALADVAAALATPEGPAELVAAVGLGDDDDQPADAGLVATFAHLVATGWAERPGDLADLLVIDDGFTGDDDPAEAIAVLALLGALDTTDGIWRPEPVLASALQTRAGSSTTAEITTAFTGGV